MSELYIFKNILKHFFILLLYPSRPSNQNGVKIPQNNQLVRFQVLAALLLKIQVLLDSKSCRLVNLQDQTVLD
jgi:hypothetical protein